MTRGGESKPSGSTPLQKISQGLKRLRTCGGAREASGLALVAAVGLGVSFLFNWFLLSQAGATADTDAVFAAIVVPQGILMVVGTLAGKILVPYFSGLNFEDQNQAAWTLVVGAGMLFSLLALVLGITSSSWLPVLFGGFGPGTRTLTGQLVSVVAWLLPLQTMASVVQALAHSRGKFMRAEGAALVGAVAGLIVLGIFFPRWGVSGFAWATIVRGGVVTAWLGGLLGSFRAPRWGFPKVFWKRMGTLAGGAALYKVNYLFDRVLSGFAPAGGLSLFHVGQQVFNAGEVILQRAVSGPGLARMAERIQAGDDSGAQTFHKDGVRLVAIVGLGAFLLFLLFGSPILSLVFAGGRLDPADIHRLWILMMALGGQVLSPVVLALSNRFYARGDAWTPTFIGLIGVPVGIALRVLFFSAWGMVGLALATSVYYGILLMIYLYLERFNPWRS